MAKLAWIGVAAGMGMLLAAQQQRPPDIVDTISRRGQQIPAIAVPDFRGSSEAQGLAGVFNETLWSDLKDSGVVKLIPKTLYPTVVPQQVSDLLEAKPGIDRAGGRLMSDWSNPPTEANCLVFGYATVVNGVFAAYGNLFDLGKPTLNTAKMIAGRRYTADLNEEGVRKAAHAFAADILTIFGGKILAGTHLYFVSSRTGHKEIWEMDYDGSNQRQITHFNFIATSPAISPDGSRLMCTAYPGEGKPARLFLYSTDPVRELAFVNPRGSYTAHSSFSPDGKQVLFDGATDDSYRIYIANLDGSGARVIRSSQDVEVQPVMNPKNPNVIAFTSGRSGTPQIYTMDASGGSLTRVTNGIGEAHNAAWAPDGNHIAFTWTQGYEPGNLNIFIIDPATGSFTQLTHAEGKNENPTWAPDGVHLAFTSTRSGKEQIWSMLANGTDLKQLTTDGSNSNAVWGN
jgi:TolB protein